MKTNKRKTKRTGRRPDAVALVWRDVAAVAAVATGDAATRARRLLATERRRRFDTAAAALADVCRGLRGAS